MDKERAYYLIGKRIDGTLDKAESAEIEAWLAKDPEHGEMVAELGMILNAVDNQMPALSNQTDSAWTDLLGRIKAEETPVIDMKTSTRGGSPLKWVAAAAVAILLMVGGYFVFGGRGAGLEEAKVFASGPGERISVSLPDGSKIQLNSGSELRAEVGFGGKERRVSLKGEAYFEVAHDPSKPFVVQVGESQTTVLGTQFNLRCYRPADPVRLSVTEGKVKFASADQKSEGVFTADQSATFDPQSKQILKSTDLASEVAGWRSGVLNFNDESLASALPRLNQFYDIDIRLGDGLQDARLTARFAEKDEAAMLDILAATFSATVRREGKVAWLEK